MKRFFYWFGAGAMILMALPSCATVGFSRVFMALEADGLRPRSVFDSKALAIACVVDMSAGIDGVTLELEIAKKDDKPGPSTYTGQYGSAEFVTRRGTTQQRIAAVWEATVVNNETEKRPAGTYRCRVRADGVQLNASDIAFFEIKDNLSEIDKLKPVK